MHVRKRVEMICEKKHVILGRNQQEDFCDNFDEIATYPFKILLDANGRCLKCMELCNVFIAGNMGIRID